jgi:hypothetical protein
MSVSSRTASVRASKESKGTVRSAELTPEILKLRDGWKPGRGAAPAALRKHALNLLSSGIKPGEVARVVGVTYQAIRLWKIAAGGGAVKPSAKQQPLVSAAGTTVTSAVGTIDVELPEGVTPEPTIQPAGAGIRLRDTAHGLSLTEQAGILELKQRHPSMGPAQIRIQLKRFNGWRISVRAIARLLKQKGYQLVHVASTPKGQTIQRFEAPPPKFYLADGFRRAPGRSGTGLPAPGDR